MKELSFNRGLSDALKIAVALVVAVHHYYYGYRTVVPDAFPIIFDVSGKIGSCGLGIFFFFSGYGLMESERRKPLVTFGDFVKRRLMKIYIPVLLVTSLWLLFFLPQLLPPPSSWMQALKFAGEILSMLLWKFSDAALWFIRSLLQLYFVFFVFVKLLRKNRLKSAWTVIVAGTILVYLIKCISNEYQSIAIPFFSIGVFASCYKSKIWHGLHISLLPMAVCLIGALLLHNDPTISELLIPNYLFMMCLIFVCTNFKPELPTVPLLGALSFDIYLVHNKISDYVFGFLCREISIWQFALLTLVLAGILYFLRSKVMHYFENWCNRQGNAKRIN